LRSFAAVLRAPAGGAESVFSLVETNAFKQLTHLALRCRPGNDASIKQARSPPRLVSSAAWLQRAACAPGPRV
jgi:hypothetical protein